MTLFLRRRAAFSAGFAQLPAGETGRGHDYTVELTVGGAINPETGMVLNIKDVDAVLKAQVIGPLHGRLFGEDMPAFRDMPPTPENLVRWVWDCCGPALPPAGRLAAVTLAPSAAVRASLSCLPPAPAAPLLEKPMLSITRTYDFSASHRLHSAALSEAENAEVFGKCNRVNGHGHNYEVEVTLAGEADPHTGQLWDCRRLDSIVEEEVLAPYDHRHLNFDVPAFRNLNPTSENLTQVIWDSLKRRLSAENLGGAFLYRVAVRETARNYFEYYGEI